MTDKAAYDFIAHLLSERDTMQEQLDCATEYAADQERRADEALDERDQLRETLAGAHLTLGLVSANGLRADAKRVVEERDKWEQKADELRARVEELETRAVPVQCQERGGRDDRQCLDEDGHDGPHMFEEISERARNIDQAGDARSPGQCETRRFSPGMPSMRCVFAAGHQGPCSFPVVGDDSRCGEPRPGNRICTYPRGHGGLCEFS